MRLETHFTERRLLTQAISDWIHEPIHYDGVPSCSYSIGPVKVMKDGSIETENADAWAMLIPFFRNHGWMPEEETEQPAETVTDEKQTRIDISMPADDFTADQLTNLLRIFYSKQVLLNRSRECQPQSSVPYQSLARSSMVRGFSALRFRRKRWFTGWHHSLRRSGSMASDWVRRSSFALTMFTRFRSVLGVCCPSPMCTWMPQCAGSVFAPAARSSRTSFCTRSMSSQRQMGLTTSVRSASGPGMLESRMTFQTRPSGIRMVCVW